MGLFDSKRRQLDDYEREVLAHPTPQNMSSLVERYMAAGFEDRALDVARRAIEKFPDNEKVQTTYQSVRKVQLQAEIQELNRALRTGATRSHYERLSEIYHRELGNPAKAFETALEGLGKFPNSDGLHLISGLIRMDRFHQDHLSNDALEAVGHFEKAAAANPDNYKSLMGLARLYAETGAYTLAQPILDRMLGANPSDRTAEQVKGIVTARLGKSRGDLAEALAEIEVRRALSPEGEEVCRLFDRTPSGPAAPAVDPAKLEEFLAGFASMNGYKCSAVLAGDAACVAVHSRGMVDAQAFIRFLGGIYRCSEDASRRMDIGTFVNGELDTPVGRIALAECKGFIVGVLMDQPAKNEDLDAAMDKIVAFVAVG